ncbi:hypothetical protein FC56_GL001305 [Lentilactobacillus senioris DSM 24302 = JCM 17472]|uniref:Transport protein n=1 Tax=Lentilactobacillus senioris DSM 24302 = JCM 17472 TaxID=1423802 RepID=A0A0R2CRB7_9LACO|nr:hypothetical protein FC56_GL001305 [Lentilactobacillus senioris DSM 24302 = JCM 17472]
MIKKGGVNLPVGPFVDCALTLLGAIVGTLLRVSVPRNIKEQMPLILGLISMSLGIVMILKIKQTPIVVLATVLGSAIGIGMHLEDYIKSGLFKLLRGRRDEHNFSTEAIDKQQEQIKNNDRLEQLIALLVLFSVSGMGIFGALNEGITHNSDMLVSKGMLDFVSALIFATLLGMLVAIAVIPQAIVLFGLFYSAALIMPLMTANMIGNLSAAGGILMLATGLRLSNIKTFPIADMVPILIIVMPLTWLLLPVFG